MQREAEIRFYISLDEKGRTSNIDWEASDSPNPGRKTTHSLMISLWDHIEKTTFSIDLWSNKMFVEDMQVQYYETFRKMAETYRKATHDEEVADFMVKFANDFGKRVGLNIPSKH
ncbi:MAG: hypothetical protein K9J16_01905 [Melioribacteraceae bacterium]|nr:hypothetical protein [Melioribacteraceae bacterium]MCF8353020.1 hypothetical protein [Melioribacteraceae bacterium]MCF8392911.1 hypothetical protein [Melioribacteraceae bacterium]MCF8417795.1 hypothetical protein [Melioribacteraceae bacterium]